MKPTFSDEEIIEDQNTRHARQKDRPTREHGDESSDAANIVPGTDCDSDKSKNETPSSNIDPSWTKSCHIHSCGNGIQHDAEGHLGC